MNFNTGYGQESVSFRKSTAGAVRTLQADEGSFRVIDPPMKGAGKSAGVALRLVTNGHVTMATDINKHSYLAIFIADDNDRPLRQLQHLEVTDCGEFVFLRDVEPAGAIHAFLELP